MSYLWKSSFTDHGMDDIGNDEWIFQRKIRICDDIERCRINDRYENKELLNEYGDVASVRSMLGPFAEGAMLVEFCPMWR